MQKQSILFVCLGNICRSPVAEALCNNIVDGKLRVSSAAITGHHNNEQADKRAVNILKSHGLDISEHRARQIRYDDWMLFDYIVALDKKVYRSLQRMKPADSKSKVILYGDIKDPYFSGRSGFVEMFEDIASIMPNFLRNNNIVQMS